ncbi:prenylated Rab acceptor protein 1 [Arctopsyche grandis]|uniref:prenylated Rab acceptor protein 1 n=1 Tax=Arctopsyche grandis TaxID=121162 RepID=UPI00406D652C
MAEPVSVEIAGEMEAPKSSPKKGFLNISQFSSYMSPASLSALVTAQKQSVRPWLLFVQTSNFKIPTTLPRLSKRLIRNIEYFRANYLFVFIALFAYCLITSPFLLLAICASLIICYKFRANPMKWKIGSYELTPNHQYALVCLLCLPIFFWAGAGSALFWVLGASITVISMHAAFYNIDAIVTEDSDDQFQLLEEV